MKVEHSGWYRTRDGRLAEVVISEYRGNHPVIGYIAGEDGGTRVWSIEGEWRLNFVSPVDLREYLGKERPKQKKTVKMAPALCKNAEGEYVITTWLYQSEERAKNNVFGFVRLLIDTHSVEVEVEE